MKYNGYKDLKVFHLPSGYLSPESYTILSSGYDEVNRMLYGMIEKPGKFVIKKGNKD